MTQCFKIWILDVLVYREVTDLGLFFYPMTSTHLLIN